MTCLELARRQLASREGAWIARVVDTIQSHNDNVEHDGVCGYSGCGRSAELLWDSP